MVNIQTTMLGRKVKMDYNNVGMYINLHMPKIINYKICINIRFNVYKEEG